MADFVKANPSAIGYMGMGSAIIDNKEKVKALNYARKPSDPYVLPSITNVYDRKYRLARELFVVYKSDQGGKVDAFLSFLTGEVGQALVLKSGYLRASLPEVEVNSSQPSPK